MRDYELFVGDTVMCVAGANLGSSKYCTVTEVSKTKKTYIVEDSHGNKFRKWKKSLQKVFHT